VAEQRGERQPVVGSDEIRTVAGVNLPRPHRRAARLGMVATLVLSVVGIPGGSGVTVRAAAPEVQSCVAHPELTLGSSGADVRCLQYLLILLGYPVGYTGTYDVRTRDAVKDWQAAHPPLHADGIAGEETLRSLGIRGDVSADPEAVVQRQPNEIELPSSQLTCTADADLVVGSTGQSVGCLQHRLIELGLLPPTADGRVNGAFDATVAAALKQFQQARPPLRADGRAGADTLAALGIWSGVSPRTNVPAVTADNGTFPGVVENEPNWAVTPQGVPFYSGHRSCTTADAAVIAREFAIDGADAATQQWAVYIASREGGCRYDAVMVSAATKDDSHCTFQINALAGVFTPHGELGRRGWTADNITASMQACADAASDLWVFCGRGPWTKPYSCRPPWGVSPSNLPIVTTTTAVAEPTTAVLVDPNAPLPVVSPGDPAGGGGGATPPTVAVVTTATTPRTTATTGTTLPPFTPGGTLPATTLPPGP
jgi:peptidoglycan hydrolase-like protein with peptidoglycan-binding domain